MKLGTSGIVINESDQVLLILRDDTRTFAPPGGSLEAGELPADNIAREVFEETGLIVTPARLAGLYMWPVKPAGDLNFVFHCTQRGGDLVTSDETLQVDFFEPRAWPKPMLDLHKERLARGLNHQSGPVFWSTQRQSLRLRLMSLRLELVVYPLMNRQLKREGKPAFVPAPQWRVSAVTLIRNKEGQILWLKNRDAWCLPGGVNKPIEAPWETAGRHTKKQTGHSVSLTSLSSVYVHPEKPEMTFVFTVNNPIMPETDCAWFRPGEEVGNVDQAERAIALDAASSGDETLFRFQTDMAHAAADD